MTERPADFVVIGSTPMARLLAGLLAGAHERRVIHVGESQSGYRLPRGIDLSVAPVTRPETWQLLREGTDETRRLLGRIAGRGGWHHADPVFFADGPEGQEALAHMRQLALAFGLAAEKVAPSLLGQGREGTLLRDAIVLNRPVIEPALDSWLDRQGVLRLRPDAITIAMDGETTLALPEDGTVRAQQAILADDAAIMAFLPVRQWPPLLRRQTSATILTAPTRPIAAPIMVQIDSGTTLNQQPEGGIAAWGPGDLAHFSGRLQGLLGAERAIEQAGQSAYQLLAPLDGAPAVGRAAGSGADIVAGFGALGSFLAPALARWLTGTASTQEADWFGARLATRGRADSPVGDYAAPARSAAA